MIQALQRIVGQRERHEMTGAAKLRRPTAFRYTGLDGGTQRWQGNPSIIRSRPHFFKQNQRRTEFTRKNYETCASLFELNPHTDTKASHVRRCRIDFPWSEFSRRLQNQGHEPLVWTHRDGYGHFVIAG